jgi:acyl carrier protein
MLDAMSYLDTIRAAAQTLNLLDDQGKLVPLDSLSVLDLVNEIERVTQISIPTSELQAEAFQTLESVSALLQKLKPAA